MLVELKSKGKGEVKNAEVEASEAEPEEAHALTDVLNAKVLAEELNRARA